VSKVLCLQLTHQKGCNNSIELRTRTKLSLSFLLDKGWVRNFQLWTDTSVDDNRYQKSNAYNWHTNNSIELRIRTKLSLSFLIDKGWVNNFQLWTDTLIDDNQCWRSNAYDWHTKKDATTALNWEREQGSHLASLLHLLSHQKTKVVESVILTESKRKILFLHFFL
jgi:hypothetical protein